MRAAAPTRIVIAADVLRPLPDYPGRCATIANTRWLHALLEWPLRRASPLPVRSITWGDGFDTEAFYRLLGASPGLESWAALHFRDTLPIEADEFVAAAFEGALVIGCELPPCLVASMDRAGIPVIDTVGTPLRFLDDILNAWRTNDVAVHERIARHRFDEALAWQQAGLIRAKAAWLPSLEIEPGTALLIGQVGSDKALIHREDGRLLGFGDYLDALFDIGMRHEHVIYKPHPYEDRYGKSASVIAKFKAFRRTDTNYYRLLAEPGLEAVYAISSGCTDEARYFGKRGERFYPIDAPPAPPLRDRHGLLPPVPVENAWLHPAFWRDVLAPLVPTLDGDEPEPPRRAHRIRRSLNADWGFLAIDEVVAAPPATARPRSVA